MSSSEKSRPKNAQQILGLLAKHYPHAKVSLDHTDAFQLLVATILSAQCTDARVNLVTPALFKRYPDPKSMAKAPLSTLEHLVKSTGFYKNKAKNIKGASQRIVQEFHGKVPDTMEGLLSLPGVARKTANVVLGNAFHKTEGIVIDTHAIRLTNRFGWVHTKNPVKIEKELMQFIPKKDWTILSHWLVRHGRSYCTARKPDCAGCFLNKVCPSAFKTQDKV